MTPPDKPHTYTLKVEYSLSSLGLELLEALKIMQELGSRISGNSICLSADNKINA